MNLKTLGSLLVGLSIILLFILVFVKIDIDRQSAFLCEQISENGLDMAQCPAHNSNVSWMIIFAFGLGFLMLGTGAYLIAAPKQLVETSRKEFRETDLSKLSKEERKVYEIIKTKGGSTFQSDLIRETNFSKVKMTRILDRLEMAGIVERKRRGMANIVVLK